MRTEEVRSFHVKAYQQNPLRTKIPRDIHSQHAAVGDPRNQILVFGDLLGHPDIRVGGELEAFELNHVRPLVPPRRVIGYEHVGKRCKAVGVRDREDVAAAFLLYEVALLLRKTRSRSEKRPNLEALVHVLSPR